MTAPRDSLRSHYADAGGVPEVFSARVADYAATRPDYPGALFDALGLEPGMAVADVGAGTGLLTRGLLDRGARVVAVEPSDAMRAASDAALGARPGYASQAGTAEATGLADASVDLVTAAQAFHWFDVPAARAEALRVLRPDGRVALVWNDRVLADPLHVAMDGIFAAFGGARRGAMLAHEDRAGVPAFFGGGAWTEQAFDHAHRLDAEGLAGLAFSRSYMPARDSAAGREAGERLDAVFRRFADGGRQVLVRYRTVLCLGRPA